MRPIYPSIALAAMIAATANAGTEGMEHMPIAQEKRLITVTRGENFEESTGFGGETATVQMMNQMMIDGSGLEGMNMSGMKMASANQAPEVSRSGVNNPSPFEIQANITPDRPKVGANQLDFTLIDSKTKKLATGLSLQAQVFMTSMDMGTEEPEVREIIPGHYRVKVTFSMKGPWAVRIRSAPKSDQERARAWENVLNFQAGTKY
ncbi:MAG: FixH family protein [Oligoflexia bacterium]|nr:FixH family protein [Oligoflexia bacterium]